MNPEQWYRDANRNRMWSTLENAKQGLKRGDKLIVISHRYSGSAVLYKLGGRMARGSKSKEGDTRVAANGYHYTRGTTKWRLTHHIIVEQGLGRSLRANERVYFRDGDRTNLAPNNLDIRVVKPKTKAAKRAEIEAKIDDLKDRLDDLV